MMNLGYTGKPYDTATGLYNYGFRDYSPQAARFTTLDPIRDGSNWFAYVNNDPVNWIDHWGLECSDSDKKVDAVTGAAPTINSVLEDTRQNIAELALSNIGSKAWNDDVKRGNFPTDSEKCNLFVYEMTSAAGASPGTPNTNIIKQILGISGYPPIAAQWNDPNYNIPGWRVLNSNETPMPGDVVSYVASDINHVAIVTGDRKATGTNYRDDPNNPAIRENDFGFRPEHEGNVTFRRWEGRN
jgi:RHS repeat-associated protein